ncbi:sterol o-acyltransferase [Anaeramoeba ignava]|uniref:O-acyltransferase n=1 Tax=Anaeramoeba ignava TaxID=1746090 RepID=A0A9Q0LMY8_ANAIG|nr:sterol o-acyltransferase [Anaeramoeba ignava]
MKIQNENLNENPNENENENKNSNVKKRINKKHPLKPRKTFEPELVPLLEKMEIQNVVPRGMLNLSLCGVFFIVLGLIITKYREEGKIVEWKYLFIVLKNYPYLFAVITIEALISFLMFLLKQLFLKKIISRFLYIFLYLIAEFSVIGSHIISILKLPLDPFSRAFLGLVTTIQIFKTFSYSFTYPKNHKKKNTKEINEKNELNQSIWKNFQNFVYFYACPSLVYQDQFPRTEKIRIKYALKELALFLGSVIIVYIIFANNLAPLLTKEALMNDFLFTVIRASPPATIAWLFIFYAFFHCWLNFLSEILYYGDRYFYGKWFNACTIRDFWRTWNILVHKFLFRHVYKYSVNDLQFRKETSVWIVFLISAFFHEFVLAGAFKLFRPYFFFAIFSQAALIKIQPYLGNYFNGEIGGNLLLWSTLYMMPLIELLYIRSWMISTEKATSNTF